ncbi:LmeA family phospholipid-binding protein [Ruania alba]|uniref:DUF2993 domain-containing protein n=1 Tax=Ruania alba TaxID=648782 RepID=A0A1H5KV98_9MICO|nr:DUF2993 domain-containing protein [Ruania alba]SEE68673.1 Protein of unknown function [Ruania alba]
MSRSGKAAIGTVVLLILILGGGYALDRWAVTRAEERITTELTGSFPDAAGVQVQIPGLLFLPQLLSGSLNTVELTADGVRYDGLDVTDVQVLAHGVDVAEPRTVDEVTVIGTVPGATVRAAVAASGRLPEEVTVDVADGAVVATATVLGVPLEATLQPVVSDGELRLEPQTFTLGGLEVDATAVPDGLLGDLGTLEVPLDALPDSLTLTSAEVLGDGVRLEVTGTDIALSSLS